ncbi:hypothetical protein BO94DRAFT_382123 [Aspergillus sclerotioniger CBS 115572]|uniref:WD40 repeat-like protein n=1 Tax=Aspergillus sclerotioniger CBS 115572 TaxID=1450535 RepID=A0A317X0Q8_9EURO|nr:hypothetical protein BO94DRAFT_382123 [Aspergillus sclerotioniger CBS 115572]PWY91875.1 hypothetical protein BO94DRAFT_382123 [Aspergillus sclerotioniger CBS 115572]
MRVITITSSFRVTIWDVDSWNSLQSAVLPIPQNRRYEIWPATMSPETGMVAFVFTVPTGQKRSIELWDIRSGNHIRTIDSDVDIFKCYISPHGRLVVSGCGRGHGRTGEIWDINTGTLVAEIRGGFVSEISPSGELIATASGGSITLLHTKTRKKMGEIEMRKLKMDGATLSNLTFSRDEQWLCTEKGLVRVASITDPNLGPMGKEITLKEGRECLLEGGKELILLPRGNRPFGLECADPSVAPYHSVALHYPGGSATTIEFDSSEHRTVRDTSEA